LTFDMSFSSVGHPVNPALRIFNWLTTTGELASDAIETQPKRLMKGRPRMLSATMTFILDPSWLRVPPDALPRLLFIGLCNGMFLPLSSGDRRVQFLLAS